MYRIFALSTLILAIACGTGSEEQPSADRLVQDCPLPDQAASLTWFGADGALHWTADAIAEDGSMTVRYCDGDIARATRITGLGAGEAIDWQEGAMTDGDRRIIHRSDIVTLSSAAPEPATRLEGVTLQCVPLLGSCEPKEDAKPAGS